MKYVQKAVLEGTFCALQVFLRAHAHTHSLQGTLTMALPGSLQDKNKPVHKTLEVQGQLTVLALNS